LIQESGVRRLRGGANEGKCDSFRLPELSHCISQLSFTTGRGIWLDWIAQ